MSEDRYETTGWDREQVRRQVSASQSGRQGERRNRGWFYKSNQDCKAYARGKDIWQHQCAECPKAYMRLII